MKCIQDAESDPDMKIIRAFFREFKAGRSDQHNVVNYDIAFVLFYLKMSRWLSCQAGKTFGNTKSYGSGIRFNNSAYFKEAIDAGRGVILLASHYGMIEVIPYLAEFYGCNKCVLYARNEAADFLSGLAAKSSISIISLNAGISNHYEISRQVLNRGGVVVLFADGFYGRHEIQLKFLNKIRGFKVGFSRLAYETNAVIIPCLSAVSPAMSIDVDFYGPVECKNEADFDDFSYSVIKQYRDFLEKAWIENRQNVLFGHQQKYLAMQKYRTNSINPNSE